MKNPTYVLASRFLVNTDLFLAGDPTGDYVCGRVVEVDLNCRWQWQAGKPTLLDWQVTAVHLDGQHLDKPEAFPDDFPIQRIINATFSRRMRALIEADPPELPRHE